MSLLAVTQPDPSLNWGFHRRDIQLARRNRKYDFVTGGIAPTPENADQYAAARALFDPFFAAVESYRGHPAVILQRRLSVDRYGDGGPLTGSRLAEYGMGFIDGISDGDQRIGSAIKIDEENDLVVCLSTATELARSSRLPDPIAACHNLRSGKVFFTIDENWTKFARRRGIDPTVPLDSDGITPLDEPTASHDACTRTLVALRDHVSHGDDLFADRFGTEVETPPRADTLSRMHDAAEIIGYLPENDTFRVINVATRKLVVMSVKPQSGFVSPAISVNPDGLVGGFYGDGHNAIYQAPGAYWNTGHHSLGGPKIQ